MLCQESLKWVSVLVFGRAATFQTARESDLIEHIQS